MYLLAVEKNNDAARRNYFSSNKWDGPKDILLTEGRLEMLNDFKRVVRQYDKAGGMLEQRKRRAHED